VILPIKEFSRLMERLEEWEDALALDEAVSDSEQEFVEYRQIMDDLKREGRL